MVDVSKVYPALLAKLGPVLVAMDAFGHPMRVCQGTRTAEYQHELWKQGRELPGKVVTNCDGYVKLSPHQLRADGYGHAVDCCFTTGEPFGEKQPWGVFGAMSVYAGLKWGGNWAGKLLDRPHVELP